MGGKEGKGCLLTTSFRAPNKTPAPLALSVLVWLCKPLRTRFSQKSIASSGDTRGCRPYSNGSGHADVWSRRSKHEDACVLLSMLQMSSPDRVRIAGVHCSIWLSTSMASRQQRDES